MLASQIYHFHVCLAKHFKEEKERMKKVFKGTCNTRSMCLAVEAEGAQPKKIYSNKAVLHPITSKVNAQTNMN